MFYTKSLIRVFVYPKKKKKKINAQSSFARMRMVAYPSDVPSTRQLR